MSSLPFLWCRHCLFYDVVTASASSMTLSLSLLWWHHFFFYDVIVYFYKTSSISFLWRHYCLFYDVITYFSMTMTSSLPLRAKAAGPLAPSKMSVSSHEGNLEGSSEFDVFIQYPLTSDLIPSYPGSNTLVPRIRYHHLIPSCPGSNTLVPRIQYPRTPDSIPSFDTLVPRI